MKETLKTIGQVIFGGLIVLGLLFLFSPSYPAAACPESEQSGGTVAGQGKDGFPGGMRISPIKVIIIRP